MMIKKVPIVSVLVMSVLILMEGVQAQEEKKVSVVGRKYLISDELLPQLGALTFAVPQHATHISLQVKGMAKHPKLSRIDGYNHNLAGQLVGSGDKPGITTNTTSDKLFVRRVTVSGSPVPIKYEIDYVDIPELTDYLKSQADLTITEDTVYKGGSIGSKADPKIVVVDGARLKLSRDFEGYGILILTGEKMVHRIWDDESEVDDIGISKETLRQDLEAAADALNLAHPKLIRMHRRVRLIMEDTASWYGMIISDIGSETKTETTEDKDIKLPERSKPQKEDGYWKGLKEQELRDKWQRDERMSPIRGLTSLREVFKTWYAKLLQPKFSYAAEVRRFIVHPRAKIIYPAPVWPRHGAKGVVIILGRQHNYWHPPYPWPIEKEHLLPDSPKRKWIDRLHTFLKDLFSPSVYAEVTGKDLERAGKGIEMKKKSVTSRKPRRTLPNPGDGVKVYGSILLGGGRPMVIMKLADIFYSQEAINIVDQKMSTLRFIWQEYKEEP